MVIEKRKLSRGVSPNYIPLRCLIYTAQETIEPEVINYHYKGACLLFKNDSYKKISKNLDGRLSLDIYLGKKSLQKDMQVEVAWTDSENNVMGVEFANVHEAFRQRSERFLTHPTIKPYVEAKDPTDPNRKIIFVVEDISISGLLLSTSLSNKHLFPAMIISRATIIIPGEKEQIIDLIIRNTRPHSIEGNFVLGCEITNLNRHYKNVIARYLTFLTANDGDGSKLKKIHTVFKKQRKIKDCLTFREITTEKEYEDVLKLRFLSYDSKGKSTSSNWRSHGEGLKNEGYILVGYLGGKLVCAAEIRTSESYLPFRYESAIGLKKPPGIESDNIVEINKVAVHPDAQSTDIILGLFQRIHIFVMLGGKPIVLLSVTDKLKKLYERLGAKKLDCQYPHPTLAGQTLTMMAIDPSLYSNGKNINPAAWNVVYGAASNYLEEIGLYNKRQLTILEKIYLVLSNSIIRLNKLSKAVNTQSRKKTISAQGSDSEPNKRRMIPSKWTEQHFTVSVINPYIVESDEIIGSTLTDQILSDMKIPRSYLSRQSNWLSVEFLDCFLEFYSEYGDVAKLSKNAGQRSMKKDILGINYYLIKHLASPNHVIGSIRKIASNFNRSRTYQLEKLGPCSINFKIGLKSRHLLPKNRVACLNWHQSLVSAFELMNRKAVITEECCVYDGHDNCTFSINWKEKEGWRKYNFLMIIYSVIGLSVYFLTNRIGMRIAPEAVVVMSLFIVTIYLQWRKLHSIKSNSVTIKEEFRDYQEDHTIRYNELQESRRHLDGLYKEVKLLEETARNIQNGSSLQDILERALNGLCDNFKFTRAFVMLKNEDATLLRCNAVSLNVESKELLQFCVDIDMQRKNSQLLSSVYHSGNSVFISDVQEHMFQLNRDSKALIKKLKTNGFMMVVIPSSESLNWGVMIADCDNPEDSLNSRDLTLLERLAYSLGIALDKEFKIETERRIRSVFQKYVPSEVISQSLDTGKVSLGGQLRQVSSMFIDIRDFTRLSESLPPQMIIEILNNFFGLADGIIHLHGGVIDKFLGDGILAIWGQQRGHDDANAVIQCAIELLESIEQDNNKQNDALKKISIGFGIATGQAICGNVGSKNRLEYTSIGPAINQASRLEGLCKSFGVPIVISDDAYVSLNQDFQSKFDVVSNVNIRGLRHNVSVWVYNGQKNYIYDKMRKIV